jgi:hypothetical protein
MIYELGFPNWLGLTITTPLGLKSELKKSLICESERDFAVNEVSNAKSPTCGFHALPTSSLYVRVNESVNATI